MLAPGMTAEPKLKLTVLPCRVGTTSAWGWLSPSWSSRRRNCCEQRRAELRFGSDCSQLVPSRDLTFSSLVGQLFKLPDELSCHLRFRLCLWLWVPGARRRPPGPQRRVQLEQACLPWAERRASHASSWELRQMTCLRRGPQPGGIRHLSEHHRRLRPPQR